MICMIQTDKQYDLIIAKCKDIFSQKMRDYGTAWRVLRGSSITDQLFIKAKRIRTIETHGFSLIEEGVDLEYVAIVNYCVMGLIQLILGPTDTADQSDQQIMTFYADHVEIAKSLMIKKNTDYGEAWREMRLSSITDLILMKIYRTKQIENHKGETWISEGIDANYLDMLNYAVFALILRSEQKLK